MLSVCVRDHRRVPASRPSGAELLAVNNPVPLEAQVRVVKVEQLPIPAVDHPSPKIGKTTENREGIGKIINKKNRK